MVNGPDEQPLNLSVEQAYEAAYRFVAQYYNRERIVPFMLMLRSMGWEEFDDHHITNDPASWSEWEACVRETLDGEPLPKISPPSATARR
jgi:hypothetical protein